MAEESLDVRRFRAVSQVDGGDVGTDTIFEYHRDTDLAWAQYAGGVVRLGDLVGLRPARPVAHACRASGVRQHDPQRSRSGSSPTRTRTFNPSVNSRMLCQLSYRGSRLDQRTGCPRQPRHRVTPPDTPFSADTDRVTANCPIRRNGRTAVPGGARWTHGKEGDRTCAARLC